MLARDSLGCAAPAKARSYSYAKLLVDVEKEYPEATGDHRRLRHLVLMRVRLVATRFAKDVVQDPQLREQCQMIHMRYQQQLEAESRDPLKVTAASAWGLTHSQSQFLSALSPSILLCFLCRSCLAYTPNEMWVKHRHHGRYACAMCHVRYRPWTSEGGRHPAQKVVALRTETTWMTFTAKWPATAEDSWLSSQAESYLRRLIGQSVDDFASRKQVALETLLKAHKWNIGLFLPAAFSAPTKLSEGTWDWEHLKGGFWYQKLSPEQAAMPPFEDWDKLVPLLGAMVRAGVSMAMLEK